MEAEYLEENEIIDLVATWLGMMPDQVLELKKRLVAVRFDKEGGFGTVVVEYRKKAVFRIIHQIQGKPTVYKRQWLLIDI